MLVDLLTLSFQFWITADWYVALFMSFCVNVFTYTVIAFFISSLTVRLQNRTRAGMFLDQRPLNAHQVRDEFFYGVLACLIFSVVSLATRVLYSSIWPESFLSLVVQIFAFTVFYETYSYFVHRLLHLNIFRSVHFVHHKSVRVTPWSAYSVHPVEAIFIGASAPVIMYLLPMSLAVVLLFHIAGMVFTMLIHSNYTLDKKILLSGVFNTYSSGHSLHHKKGSVNYGFISPLWDVLFQTKNEV